MKLVNQKKTPYSLNLATWDLKGTKAILRSFEQGTHVLGGILVYATSSAYGKASTVCTVWTDHTARYLAFGLVICAIIQALYLAGRLELRRLMSGLKCAFEEVSQDTNMLDGDSELCSEGQNSASFFWLRVLERAQYREPIRNMKMWRDTYLTTKYSSTKRSSSKELLQWISRTSL